MKPEKLVLIYLVKNLTVNLEPAAKSSILHNNSIGTIYDDDAETVYDRNGNN